MTSSRNLPPFSALRAFHAAARHLKFKDAAAELGLSESAISHQIRNLEDILRVRLFERSRGGLALTKSGERYFVGIDQGIAALANATDALNGKRQRERVVLTLPPSLATLWLIPRLGELGQAHPNIDLQLFTTVRVCDLLREQIDLAIRYGSGKWQGVISEPLMEEFAMPVCHRDYIVGCGTQFNSGLLTSARFIVNGHHPDEWIEWAAGRKIDPPEMGNALHLESSEQVLEAAARGLGIAIGRTPLVNARIASGELIVPFGEQEMGTIKYHLCYPNQLEPRAPAKRIFSWLKALADQSGMAVDRPGANAEQ